MRSLYSCIRRLVLARKYLFSSLCAHRFHPAYTYRILCMQDPSCACMAPSKNPSLGIFHLFAILTSSLTIFAFNCTSHVISHPIVNPISLSYHFFHLIVNLIILSFCRFLPHILVGEVPAMYWCGTTTLPRRLGATFVLRVLSLSSI